MSDLVVVSHLSNRRQLGFDLPKCQRFKVEHHPPIVSLTCIVSQEKRDARMDGFDEAMKRIKRQARRRPDALAAALYRVEAAFAGTGLTAVQAVRIAHLAAQTAKD